MISAPVGSIITEDGSLVAADGTVLAPPGSIVTEQESLNKVDKFNDQIFLFL